MAALDCSLYIDVISPWTLAGLEVLLRYERLWNLNIDIKPVLLGGIFTSTKNPSPVANPVKYAYMQVDMRRSSEFFGVDFRGIPSNVAGLTQAPGPKFSSLTAQRLLTQVREVHGSRDQRFRALIRFLFRKFVYEGAHAPVVVTDELLENACTSAGFSLSEARALVKASNSSQIRNKLKDLTNEAVGRGAFGLPFLYFEGEDVPPDYRAWFGAERFEQMARAFDKPWLGPNPVSPTSKL